jgi:plasmid maintenance system antidote protein VapI
MAERVVAEIEALTEDGALALAKHYRNLHKHKVNLENRLDIKVGYQITSYPNEPIVIKINEKEENQHD